MQFYIFTFLLFGKTLLWPNLRLCSFTFLHFYFLEKLFFGQIFESAVLHFYIFTYSQRHPKDPTLGKLPSGAMALAPQFYFKEKPHGKNVHWRCGASATAPPQGKIRRKVAKWRCDASATAPHQVKSTRKSSKSRCGARAQTSHQAKTRREHHQ